MLKSIMLLCCVSFLSVRSISQSSNVMIEKSFREYMNGSMTSTVSTFRPSEAIQGSPYLFDNWVKGNVILKNNQILKETEPMLNYDKIQKQLIVKITDNQILSVNMQDIEQFSLEDKSASITLINIPEISASPVVQLYKDSFYALYKLIDTQFFKADYENKGLYESGHKYDRYIDKASYFIIANSKKTFSINSGSKNDIKKLSASLPEVNQFLKDNNSIIELDQYLINLTVFLSRQKSQ